jgi:hypothetical protein
MQQFICTNKTKATDYSIKKKSFLSLDNFAQQLLLEICCYKQRELESDGLLSVISLFFKQTNVLSTSDPVNLLTLPLAIPSRSHKTKL